MNSQIVPAKHSKIVDFFINYPLVRIFVFEFIGTGFLLFMVLCINTLPPVEGHPIVQNAYKMVYVVLIVMATIAFVGPFTGSQINPAVTFGLYLPVWKTQYKTILTYWAAQYSGALVGVILNRNIMGHGGPIFPEMPDFLTLTRMGVEQMTGATLLVFFVHVLITKETTFTHQMGQEHLMIVIVYYLCLSISCTLHCMNPAVIFSLQVESMIENGTSANGLPACAVIIIFQLLGAAFASLLFRKVYLPQLIRWRKTSDQM